MGKNHPGNPGLRDSFFRVGSSSGLYIPNRIGALMQSRFSAGLFCAKYSHFDSPLCTSMAGIHDAPGILVKPVLLP